jgi:hypothetical protein
MIHFYRNDINFLEKITNSSKELKKMLFIENIIFNAILSSIFSFISIIQNAFFNANIDFISFSKYIILPLSSFIIFLLPLGQSVKKISEYNFDFQFIPYNLFEVKYLFRKYYPMIILIFLLSLASYFHIIFIVVTFIISLSVLLNFTQFNEPKEVVNIKNAKQFLLEKILINIKYCIFIILPICIISIIFHIEFWLLIIYIFISYLISITFLVIYKYSVYDSKTSSNQNIIPITIFFVFLIIPAGILVNVLYCAFYYPKSIKNIENELIN